MNRPRLSPVLVISVLLFAGSGAIAQSLDPTAPQAPLDPGLTYQGAWNVEYVGHVGGPTNAVALQGVYAYIGEGPALTVLDVSTPGSPAVRGKTVPMPANPEGIAVAGGYAYIADGGAGLRVVDVSDPLHPSEVGFYHTPGTAFGVAVAEANVYLAVRDAGLLILRSALVHPSRINLPLIMRQAPRLYPFRSRQERSDCGREPYLHVPACA